MFADIDWCNIYHVCVGNRDNIFLCPPGTIFNDTKQGCMDRYDGSNCNGTRSYYKPSSNRQKRADLPIISKSFQSDTDFKQLPGKDIPDQWKKSYQPKQVLQHFSFSSILFFSSSSIKMATVSLIRNSYSIK